MMTEWVEIYPLLICFNGLWRNLANWRHQLRKIQITKFGVIAFKIYWVIRDSPKSYIINWSVRKIYINFKTQPEPVSKNATPRPTTGNRTCDPGSLDQRSTDWTTEVVAVSLGTSSLWRRANARNVRLYTIRIGSTPTFYISICISTLPTQHTTFSSVYIQVVMTVKYMGILKDNIWHLHTLQQMELLKASSRRPCSCICRN